MMRITRWKQIIPYLARIAPYSHNLPNTFLGLYDILALPDRLDYLPEQVKLETTTRCNLACQFCGRTWAATWARGQNQIPDKKEDKRSLLNATRHAGKNLEFSTFKNLIDQFPYLSKMDVQGMGEPLINPDFIPMLEFASSRNITTQFFTNATLLSREMSNALMQQRISEISISLDGATAQTYEFIRFGANYFQVVDNISELVEARKIARKKKPIIRLSAVITSQNVEELPNLIRLGHELGVDQIVATQFKCISTSLDSWIPDQETLIRIIDESRHTAAEYKLPLAIEFAIQSKERVNAVSQSISRCLYPWFSINITIDGNLTPCSYLPLAEGWGLGNVFQTPFADIWNSETYQKLRRNMRNGNLQQTFCQACIDKV